MKKRFAAAVVAILAWCGYAGVSLLGAVGQFDDIEWTRVCNGLLGVAIVASMSWMQVTFAVVPRSAFRAGVEVGERRARRVEQTRSLIPFPVLRVPERNGHKAPRA